jgi:hypothetical protein
MTVERGRRQLDHAEREARHELGVITRDNAIIEGWLAEMQEAACDACNDLAPANVLDLINRSILALGGLRSTWLEWQGVSAASEEA